MMKSLFFEDYVIGSSRETGGRTITETDLVWHAGHTGDFYPHHTDAEWSKTQAFGQRIAHGTLILSVAIGMAAGEVNPESFAYGYDRLRFIKPVFIGDTIRVKVTVKEKREHRRKLTHGIVVAHCEVFNQRQELVLAGDQLIMVKKKNAGS